MGTVFSGFSGKKFGGFFAESNGFNHWTSLNESVRWSGKMVVSRSAWKWLQEARVTKWNIRVSSRLSTVLAREHYLSISSDIKIYHFLSNKKWIQKIMKMYTERNLYLYLSNMSKKTLRQHTLVTWTLLHTNQVKLNYPISSQYYNWFVIAMTENQCWYQNVP